MAETIHYHDPATGQVVTEVVAADGTSTFLNPDGSAFGGDVTTLTVCGSGPTERVIEIDYCGFDTAELNAPRLITCDGDITSAELVTTTGPVGGDETFSVLVNGVAVGTATLTAGSTTATFSGTPYPVTAGDVVTLEMTSTTATTASGIGSLTMTQECA